MTPEHQYEIFKIALDRVLLGLVIIGCTFYLNKLLEKFRGKIIYKQKLLETRISSYQDMSSQALLLYLEANESILMLKKVKSENFDPKDFPENHSEKAKEVGNRVESKMNDFRVAFARCAIFLTEDIKEKSTDFLNAFGLLRKSFKDETIWKENFSESHTLLDKKMGALISAITLEISTPPE